MSHIVVSNATKSFGSRQLFTGLSFDVPAGQMTALTGRSGSGKSTLLNCIGLLETLSAGTIEVGGGKVTGMNTEQQRRFRRDVLGYMFQNYALIENATVRENLEVAVAAKGRRAATESDYAGALARVGMSGREKEPVHTLSGGEQQRIALARLMIKKPSVILADEPTGALDSENTRMVLEQLQWLADDGAAVLIATHSRDVVRSCAEVLTLEN